MRRCHLMVGAALIGVGCAEPAPPEALSDSDLNRTEIVLITDRLAASISQRDAVGAAEAVPQDSSIVYISDGSVIRGIDYVPVLETFYSRVDSLQFHWTEREISFPTPSSAMFIGWASIRAKVGDNDWVDDPAIFTALLTVDASGTWSFVTIHKTSTGR